MLDAPTVPADLPGAAAAAAAQDAHDAHDTHPAPRRLAIEFTGSGSEYFRIWIVNLLLTLVTLGLYYPWAKVRRLRYFHGATELGGHPFAFHAEPSRMLRGYLLVGAMVLLYSVASRLSVTGGLIAFVLVAALWPALWHSSLCFRLANTSWRGLRFRFTGARRAAYRVMALPIAAAFFVVLAGVLMQPNAEAARKPDGAAVLLALLPTLLFVIVLPAFLWLLRRYQHQHYALGGEQTRFAVPLRAFYGIFGLAVLGTIALGLVFFGVGFVAVGVGPVGGMGKVLLFGLMPVGFYVLVFSLIGAYVTARLQNIVWNGTRSQHLQFDSQLGVVALARLSLKNILLIIVTLGLYFPFAAIASARLRLEALSVRCAVDPDALVAQAAALDESAAGDAAGDLFGFDIGL